MLKLVLGNEPIQIANHFNLIKSAHFHSQTIKKYSSMTQEQSNLILDISKLLNTYNNENYKKP